jgi:hypothetical protein
VGGEEGAGPEGEEGNEPTTPTLVRSRRAASTPAKFVVEGEIEDEDPDRSVELSDLLLKDYDRKTIDQICNDEGLRVALESSDAPEMQVWVNSGEKWDNIDSGVVFRQKWSEKNKKFPQSACRMLIKDFFGLSEAQYKRIRHEFNRQKSGDLVGIYKAKEGKEVPAIVLVVRVPKSAWGQYGTLGAGGLASAAAGGLALWGTQKASQSDWLKTNEDFETEKNFLETELARLKTKLNDTTFNDEKQRAAIEAKQTQFSNRLEVVKKKLTAPGSSQAGLLEGGEEVGTKQGFLGRLFGFGSKPESADESIYLSTGGNAGDLGASQGRQTGDLEPIKKIAFAKP